MMVIMTAIMQHVNKNNIVCLIRLVELTIAIVMKYIPIGYTARIFKIFTEERKAGALIVQYE
jgi:hypothetical protein